MADETQDDSQKTEEPTQKRLQDARDKGQVAKSQEVSHWFMIMAFAILLAFFLPSSARSIGDALLPFVEMPHAIRLDRGGLSRVLAETLGALGLAMLLPLLFLMVVAFLSGFVQTGLVVSAEKIKPKWEKISLIKGFKRLFSLRALVEFGKGLAKLAIVGLVIGLVLWPEHDVIPAIATLEMKQFLELVRSLGLRVLIAVAAVMTVIAGLDFMFQKAQHMKQLRMSKQELKDEFKQTEGDPMVKARLRQIRTERARQRMMAAVPEADVVVTNPTHYAVALKYEMDSMAAPKVTAKGVDHIALKIREVAEEHKVPLVENPPLARALYASVELDQEVPQEHYKAVAEVISYVMRLKGKMPAGARR
ncbi:MAG: flagellar biosynthesis protein FlhB [Kiloniellales bacterium]